MSADWLHKASGTDMYSFDCAQDAAFCAAFDVVSFPTIRIFDHREWRRYRGKFRASA